MSETTTTTDVAPTADGRPTLEMVGQAAATEATGGCCGGACCAV